MCCLHRELRKTFLKKHCTVVFIFCMSELVRNVLRIYQHSQWRVFFRRFYWKLLVPGTMLAIITRGTSSTKRQETPEDRQPRKTGSTRRQVVTKTGSTKEQVELRNCTKHLQAIPICICKNSKILKNNGNFRIPHPQINLKQFANSCENVVFFLTM